MGHHIASLARLLVAGMLVLGCGGSKKEPAREPIDDEPVGDLASPADEPICCCEQMKDEGPSRGFMPEGDCAFWSGTCIETKACYAD